MKLKAKSYLFDTHAHVNFAAFKDDADEVIKKSLNEGIFIINVGSQYSTSKRAVEMAEKYKLGVWSAVGLHPIHIKSDKRQATSDKQYEEFNYEKYLELAKNPKVVAIGEMGLDHHHFIEGDHIEELKEKQKVVFLQGIKLANEVDKPMIIHCWDAYDELIEILRNWEIRKKGVIHSFVGGHKTARKFIELGYKIGLNGVITYSDSFSRLIKELSLNDMVLETDCPYLTPVPKKGERNEPAYIQYVAKKIAGIKKISFNEVAEITTKNAKEIFNFS
jgi:TatD DNase family protein